jgi:CubicO group peptidase (beta-lactamase class C family)
MRRAPVVALIALLAFAPGAMAPVAPKTAAPTVAVLPPGLDAFVAQVMRAFEVPGLALSVVKDGEVVLAKGYGVRRLGDPALVDGQTLFGIASNTKVFTAVALALLVEEGKIEWDAPVLRYLPWFQMWDPWVTRELTVRDLLAHRSGLGLGAGDLLWWPPSTYDRKEVARRIRFLRPARGRYAALLRENGPRARQHRHAHPHLRSARVACRSSSAVPRLRPRPRHLRVPRPQDRAARGSPPWLRVARVARA